MPGASAASPHIAGARARLGSRRGWTVLCTALVSFAGCAGEQSISLTVSPESFAADGMTVAEVVATVVFRGESVADGKRIRLYASAPVLFADADKVAPGKGDNELSLPAHAGAVHAVVLAPTEAMQLSLTASFTTVNHDVLSATRTLSVAPPPLISAGRYSENPTQADAHFAFGCNVRSIGGVENIGAFVTDRPTIRLPCTLLLEDAAGRSLPDTPVRFFAEAGEIEDQPALGDTPRTVTYLVAPSPLVLPHNVDPTQAESAAGLVDFDGDGVAINPRDGLVTLLAVVRGQEAFDDINHNGTRDAGEPFLDEGEPFLDVDDDGVYDPAVDPPFCCDNNGNGRVDGPNGRWDSDVWIGRMAHVLWTGPVDLTRSHILPPSADVAAGGSTVLSLRLVDARFNPVAGGDPDDEVRFALTPSTKVSLEPPVGLSPTSNPIANASGMVLRHHPSFIFGAGVAEFADLIMDQPTAFFRDFPLLLVDKRSPTAVCSASSWALEVRVATTPASGSGFATHDAVLTAGGSLAAKPDPCP